MEALSQLWRVLGIIVQGIYSLGKKIWDYRLQKIQQKQLEHNQVESPVPIREPQAPTSQAPTSPSTLDPLPKIIPLRTETGATPIRSALGQWYPPNQAVQIQDLVIADGLIYVGPVLSPHEDHQDSVPGLINPDLPIQMVSANQRQSIFEEDWPHNGTLSYEALSPEMRGIFLGWLATGRKEREIPASALILFLYGLEHRVIELLQGDRTLDELLALMLELERLEVQYVHHQSIIPNIQRLIECCQVQLALSCQPETLLALLPTEPKLSMALKVALGRCLETAKPIPMTLLWAWYQRSSVAVDLKTPAKRCESAFNFLIQTRGAQQGCSFRTGENPVMLPVVYEPFSPIFGKDATSITVIETIDIAELEPQLTCLEPLIEDCTHDLDAYSRLIGRSPEAEGTPPAVALLPQELVLLSGNDQVQMLQQWLNQQVGSKDWAMVAGLDLLTYWPTATPNKIRKKEAELLGILMAKLGFGYAPDVRYSQGTFNPQHAVVLFRLHIPGVQAISSQYPLALTILELIPFSLPPEEEESRVPIIAIDGELSPSERSRLIAFKQWRHDHPLTWKQVLKRVKKLSTEHQEQLAIALNSELQKHWRLEEARYVELQSIISLPKRETPKPTVAADAKGESKKVESKNEEKVESKNEEKIDAEDQRSDALSAQNNSVPPAFVLDSQLIAQRNQESQVASGLLSDIFTEEDSHSSLPIHEESMQPEQKEPVTLTLGLDEFHWHLLNHLGQKESWERSEIEAIAQNQGLLLDGALENINDVAFDHCDEALTEGEDPIEVNDWVFDQLKAA